MNTAVNDLSSHTPMMQQYQRKKATGLAGKGLWLFIV